MYKLVIELYVRGQVKDISLKLLICYNFTNNGLIVRSAFSEIGNFDILEFEIWRNAESNSTTSETLKSALIEKMLVFQNPIATDRQNQISGSRTYTSTDYRSKYS